MAIGVNTTTPAARQRTKILAAILLGLTLLVVLSRRSDEPLDVVVNSAPQPAERPQSAISPTPSTALKADSAGRAAQRHLPAVEMRRILANNPFSGKQDSTATSKSIGRSGSAVSSTARDPENRQPGDGADHLEKKAPAAPGVSPIVSVASEGLQGTESPTISVSAIVMGGGRPAALIGDQLFYEDDAIDSRWKILAIRSHSIVVQPMSASTSHAD